MDPGGGARGDCGSRMKNDPADRVWAMLALSSAEPAGSTSVTRRITGFIGRDKSPGAVVAGSAGWAESIWL